MKKIYFAPLEGITGYIYRNAYNDLFGSKIDKYFTPFISPGINQVLSKKEMRDILPENNNDIPIVPQILASRASDALLAIDKIAEYGYKEFNINLGCPSGTVVAKKKGSGMLAEPIELERFLDEIFEKTSYDISLKTRIGKENYDDWEDIVKIYNKFPLKELIIHPRIQKDFYKNEPRLNAYRYAYENSVHNLCYNGDIFSREAYVKISELFPDTTSVMLGRGILLNPFLPEQIRSYICHVENIQDKGESDENTSVKKFSEDEFRKKLIDFHERLLGDYREEMSGERPVLFKMKELWVYMSGLFSDIEGDMKKIKKSEKLLIYIPVAENILRNGKLKKEAYKVR